MTISECVPLKPMVGVVKSLGYYRRGAVGLVRTQRFGIQSEKPTLDGVPARSTTSVFGGTADIAFQAGHVGS